MQSNDRLVKRTVQHLCLGSGGLRFNYQGDLHDTSQVLPKASFCALWIITVSGICRKLYFSIA